MQALAVAATTIAQAGSGLDVDVTLGQGLAGSAVSAAGFGAVLKPYLG